MSTNQRRLLIPVGLMASLGLLAALAGDPRIFAFAVPAAPTPSGSGPVPRPASGPSDEVDVLGSAVTVSSVSVPGAAG